MSQNGEKKVKRKLAWFNILGLTMMHVHSVYIIYKAFAVPEFPWRAVIIGYVIGFFGLVFGVIIGVHRMWSHKSFKARWPLRLFLAFCNQLAGQGPIYNWARDHRVHHKFSDTDADPHNITNGFFYSHVGWLCVEKHPDVKKKGEIIDLSDLEKDWVVMFQKKHYEILYLLVTHVLPTAVIAYVGNIEWYYAWGGNLFRYVVTLHITWCTNSFAHSVGYRPYDKNIRPSEFKIQAWFGGGEGYHNFHHAFPWDYKLSELVHKEPTYIWRFIDFFAYIGQAYDLKTVSQDMIKKRVIRTGDGTHPYSKMLKKENNNADVQDEKDKPHVWGWDDKAVTEVDKRNTIITHKTH